MITVSYLAIQLRSSHTSVLARGSHHVKVSVDTDGPSKSQGARRHAEGLRLSQELSWGFFITASDDGSQRCRNGALGMEGSYS